MNKYIIRVIIFLLCLALGIIIPQQIRNNTGDNSFVTLSTIKQTQNKLEKTKSEVIDIKKIIKEQEKKLEKIETANNTTEIISLLESDIERFKSLGGFKDLSGPGIVIKIQDSAEDFVIGQSDTSGIVHDADIQNILNDLKVAGAEAIDIGGQRVILNSPVRCGGPVIRVNKKNLVSPFIIKAIGDPNKLYSAINAQGTYGRYLNDARDLQIESEERDLIVIPKYNDKLEVKYMNPIEEGE
ncbi:DUF881 domain-containing protein [Senegalia massiliensis]|uniref:DUF881 domain-containing protein n=1 Tax=Senegalia massiliensis TaxID=1720316 RepID=A0A845QZY7_9CLOT|nr:DUF881 domain-containing protein [Senegalia massiliensis]NBI06752.1 DUF881 domain-containing protein [Senegalia massiliensis]